MTPAPGRTDEWRPGARSQHPWRADYYLVYDRGTDQFSRNYRTRFGAQVSIWWHVHVSSLGGSAFLVPTTGLGTTPEYVDERNT
jgi:hypothetical protein